MDKYKNLNVNETSKKESRNYFPLSNVIRLSLQSNLNTKHIEKIIGFSMKLKDQLIMFDVGKSTNQTFNFQS